MKKLNKSKIEIELNSLDRWIFDQNFIVKTFYFRDFSEAFGFLCRVALISEHLAHHPDWSGVYNQVTLKLSTHDVGGLTETDFKFARKVEELILK